MYINDITNVNSKIGFQIKSRSKISSWAFPIKALLRNMIPRPQDAGQSIRILLNRESTYAVFVSNFISVVTFRFLVNLW